MWLFKLSSAFEPKFSSILSIAEGENVNISVCLGCFICGKSNMTHWGWTKPRTGWTNYSGLDNVSNTDSEAKNSSLRGKNLSIGCDHYNFQIGTLSKPLGFKFLFSQSKVNIFNAQYFYFFSVAVKVMSFHAWIRNIKPMKWLQRVKVYLIYSLKWYVICVSLTSLILY